MSTGRKKKPRRRGARLGGITGGGARARPRGTFDSLRRKDTTPDSAGRRGLLRRHGHGRARARDTCCGALGKHSFARRPCRRGSCGSCDPGSSWPRFTGTQLRLRLRLRCGRRRPFCPGCVVGRPVPSISPVEYVWRGAMALCTFCSAVSITRARPACGLPLS